MIHTDYKIEALCILLDKDCLTERYYPLIPYKEHLLSEIRHLPCKTKSDIEKLPDNVLMKSGMDNAEMIRLFRRFLTIYDPNPRKFKEIANLCSDPEEQAAFRELYYLPGVKYVRASLYYRSGYKTLADLASAAPEEIMEKTARTIAEHDLSCIVPLPKEVRTHIAVSKAFTAAEN